MTAQASEDQQSSTIGYASFDLKGFACRQLPSFTYGVLRTPCALTLLFGCSFSLLAADANGDSKILFLGFLITQNYGTSLCLQIVSAQRRSNLNMSCLFFRR